MFLKKLSSSIRRARRRSMLSDKPTKACETWTKLWTLFAEPASYLLILVPLIMLWPARTNVSAKPTPRRKNWRGMKKTNTTFRERGTACRQNWMKLHGSPVSARSEEHTSELQSQSNLVCRLLLVDK